MTVDEILSELRRLAEPQRVVALKRSGVAACAFGVCLPELRSLAKRIGRDHERALALWQEPIREARILASLIDERERVTEKQMDRWAESFDSWEICDQCCQNLFAHTVFAPAKAVEWMRRPEELVKRAGFVLVAVRAVRDKRADDQAFADLLPDAHRGSRRRAALCPKERQLGAATDWQEKRTNCERASLTAVRSEHEQ